MSRRIGILSFSSPGHYYPLTALGRRLQSRGHDVVYFQVADLEWPIRAAGLRFRQIGREDFPPSSLVRHTPSRCTKSRRSRSPWSCARRWGSWARWSVRSILMTCSTGFSAGSASENRFRGYG